MFGFAAQAYFQYFRDLMLCIPEMLLIVGNSGKAFLNMGPKNYCLKCDGVTSQLVVFKLV